MPCSFCVKIPLGLVTEFLQKVFSFAISLAARQCYHTAKPSRRALSQSDIQTYDKGGFPMDRVYIIAIVAAIVLLAIHLIRDYGNRE